MAVSRRLMTERIAATFCGPSGFVCRSRSRGCRITGTGPLNRASWRAILDFILKFEGDCCRDCQLHWRERHGARDARGADQFVLPRFDGEFMDFSVGVYSAIEPYVALRRIGARHRRALRQ